MAKQTQTFQAETSELLDLMIHSLYSHREIFLRELISNSSDAIEKLKFESLTDSSLAAFATDFKIQLVTDPEKKTLSIADNGIGMTWDEVVKNIGTIAHSGTKSFLKMRQELKEHPELIGQFGVGFYSAFMVAHRVVVQTQKAGSHSGVLWESDGNGTYTIEESVREQGHGTTVTLYLKDLKEEDQETQDFTDTGTLKMIVKKYSDFIVYPIQLKEETLNGQKALWLRPATEISQNDYNEFYTHISHDPSVPLKTIHYKAEGTMEFSSILYIPSQKPFNYDYRDNKVGLNLYVKRVFIKGECGELLPPYLRFVQGVVDSDDLSLNVSRELLQQDRQIVRIKKALTSKVLNSLKEFIDSDRPSYEKFWMNFGSTLKEGVAVETASIDKIQDLVLFHSTESDRLTTLQEYVGRMKPTQNKIYYITGDSLTQIQNSPYLEKLRSKGFEVILMNDKIDAWFASSLRTYGDKALQSVTAHELELNTEEEKKMEEEKNKVAELKFKPLLDIMHDALKEQVQEIKLSDRLTESPVCLVSSDNALSAHMERLLESMGQSMPKAKRVMEINPDHPLYESMLKASSTQQIEWAEILYQQALLNEGSPIENPLKYSQKIANLMISAGHS